jgi:transposase
MNPRRRFTVEVKRQVVERLLSGTVSAAQVCREYEISSSLLYHWRRQYSRGRFGNEATAQGALENRVRELERLVGELTFENRLLKKVAELATSGRNERSSRRLNRGKSGGGAG